MSPKDASVMRGGSYRTDVCISLVSVSDWMPQRGGGACMIDSRYTVALPPSAVTLMESAVVWSLVPRSCSRSSLGLLQRPFRRFSLRLSWLVCSRCRSLLFLLFLTSPSIFIPLPPHSHPSPVSLLLPLFILNTFFLLSPFSSPRRHSRT